MEETLDSTSTTINGKDECTPPSPEPAPEPALPDSKEQPGLTSELYPETDLDRGIVGWDSQDDPCNPRNFPEARKWLLLGFISAIAFLSPLCSSIVAPAVTFIDMEFHNTSSILSSLVVTIFVFGFAVGPLLLSPLSEIFGRRPVLTYANAFFSLWQIGCAKAPSLHTLIAFRFLGGLGASGCLTIGGGVIADLFPVEQRGLANAIFSVGPLFGPVIAPIIGGFIAQRAGWRWVFWVMLIACTVLSTTIAVVNKETNPIVLMRNKVERFKKELGRGDLRSAYEISTTVGANQKRNILLRGMTMPLRMLFSSPILLLLSLYLSFVFGLLYLLFTTVTTLFVNSYGWAPNISGLAYLGIGFGFMLGIVTVAKTSDATVVRLTAANNGVYQPEMRLASCIFFAFFVPISFFWYGWSADKHTHWIVPILGLFPFGFGMMGIFAPIQTYFIDTGGKYAASAVAALTVLRCIFGAFLPLAGPKLFSSLGYGWGNSLLGFIALALIPAPALIFKYGGKIRSKYPVVLE
ncbi:related to synaptic vesicle transporter SVOP and related transporters (major facilitator superfamily) [Phialocephala subalpina]|uniref:Related to synaptic vesicle transporter SVOP and related transporters (Major facilitator superfamily) n=1 Tax=Phialocephala subalpina TaxID=576137 RepID=A0A1L7WC58_9HELO|nr:related to synaptic vesicle transporter SVOP and related transporters (major facilitator superfamily) [Phialocephala subalpina]